MALPIVALLCAGSGCSSPPAQVPAAFPTPSESSAHHAPGTGANTAALTPTPAPRFFTTRVMLHGEPLELHMAAPDTAPSTSETLVIYASGDGGWFGAAVDMFKRMAEGGYPVVGFSSKAFLKIQRPHGALVNAAQLAADYEAIVSQARAALHQNESSRVVFTGWSRGAAFSVLAGSEPVSRNHLAGVIAIGLGPGEDLAAVSDDDATDDDAPGDASNVASNGASDVASSHTPSNRQSNESPGAGRRWQFDTYAMIGRLEPVACAVIQATHDHYLPAAQARRLFGPDTDSRRLYAIDARNHRFTGGKRELDAALLDALRWITSSSRTS